MRELGLPVRAIALACALLTIGVFDAPTAGAQEDAAERDQQAQLHFRAGRARYDEGRFREAAREFEAALALSGRAVLYYNLFLAYRDDGNFAEAIRTLSAYLEQVPDAPDRERLQSRLDSMRRVAERQAEQEAEAQRAAEEAAAAEREAEEAARRAAEAEEAARRAGETAANEGESGDGEESGLSMWTPGWIIAGVGGAALIGGVVTGVMTSGIESDLETRCTERPDGSWSCPPGSEDDAASGQTLAAVTDALLIGGGVILATGVVLAFVIDAGGEDAAEAAAHFDLGCDGQGCVATVSGSF